MKAQTNENDNSPKNYSESVSYTPTEVPSELSKVKKKKDSKKYDEKNTDIPVGDDSVLIPVSVFNKDGKFVVGLKADDFKVFVDGAEQNFELVENKNEPLNIYLLIDTSPSTKERLELIRDMISTFIEGLKPEDKVAIMAFNDKFKVLNELTNDRTIIKKSIKNIEFGSGTAFYEAVSEFFQNRVVNKNNRNALLIFSDGVDTTSEMASFTTSLAEAERFNMPIFSVYFDTLEDFSKLKNINLPQFGFPPRYIGGDSKFEYELGKYYLNDLTRLSGGRAISADKIAAGEKSKMLNAIDDELRLKYYLKIKPAGTPEKDGRHQIKVRVEKPNLFVMARGSYNSKF